MNTVTITRTVSDEHETRGILIAKVGGATFTCKTLELPWKNNQSNVSCIPKGTYPATYQFWWSKMSWNYFLSGVFKRVGIALHAGNYGYNAKKGPDTEGCILLGADFADINGDGVQDIITSRDTVRAFNAFMGKQPFTLTIQ